MKRFIAFLLIVTLLFALCACKEKEDTKKDNSKKDEETVTETLEETATETTTGESKEDGGEENPEEETPEEEEEENDGMLPGFPITRLIDLFLPGTNDMMSVSVLVDGVLEETFDVDPITVVDNKVQIAIDGIGLHQIDVLINGILWNSFTYDFDAGVVMN